MSKSVKPIQEYEGYHPLKVYGIGKGYVFQSDTNPYDIILVRSQDSVGSVSAKLTSNLDEIYRALGNHWFHLSFHLFGTNTEGYREAAIRYIETHSTLVSLAFIVHVE